MGVRSSRAGVRDAGFHAPRDRRIKRERKGRATESATRHWRTAHEGGGGRRRGQRDGVAACWARGGAAAEVQMFCARRGWGAWGEPVVTSRCPGHGQLQRQGQRAAGAGGQGGAVGNGRGRFGQVELQRSSLAAVLRPRGRGGCAAAAARVKRSARFQCGRSEGRRDRRGDRRGDRRCSQAGKVGQGSSQSSQVESSRDGRRTTDSRAAESRCAARRISAAAAGAQKGEGAEAGRSGRSGRQAGSG